MTLTQCIAEGSGIAIGFQLVNGLGKAVGEILLAAAHGWRPDIFSCHNCYRKAPCGCGCPHPACKIPIVVSLPVDIEK